MSSGAWRRWPIHNPALAEELVQRVKQEISRRAPDDYKFRIGGLEFWHHHNSYELRRLDVEWNERLIIRGEKATNSFSDWGSEESALFATGLLRQRQVLEDMADA